MHKRRAPALARWHGIDVGQRSAAILDEQPSHRALTQPRCSTLHRHAVRPERDQARSSPVATATAAWPAATAQAVPAAPKSRGSPLVPWRLLKAPSTACGHRSRWSCQACRLKEHRSPERVERSASDLQTNPRTDLAGVSSQCVSSSRWPLRELCVPSRNRGQVHIHGQTLYISILSCQLLQTTHYSCISIY